MVRLKGALTRTAPLLLGVSMLTACAPSGCSEQARGKQESEASPARDPALPGVKRPDAAFSERLAQVRDEKEREGALPRASSGPKFLNRLILERSPYLLAHAKNPVNWFPWGEQALARARAENKPIFLSIGYATCHWCHVMEEESFEDKEIATYLNTHFVAIKVDREQRPDVDALYMKAVRVLSGSGGWPMTLILTPEAKPFFGGTYLPARDGERGAQKGLLTVLREMKARYSSQQDSVLEEAAEVSRKVREASRPLPPGDLPGVAVLDRAAQSLLARRDRIHGGFTAAPKFPRPVNLEFLLGRAARAESREAGAPLLEAVGLTLDRMSKGGIFDQLGGGFHRYSTDVSWTVPHFEKMLYDNALLADVYLQAFQATGDASYRNTARRVLDFLLEGMRSETGGFFSAIDADSLNPSGALEEGYFYTWTPEQVQANLGEIEAEVAQAYFRLEPKPELQGRSVMEAPHSLEEAAVSIGVDALDLEQILSSVRAKLLQVRNQRPVPAVDSKVLTGQNGLAIASLAHAAFVTGQEKYLKAARMTADLLLKRSQGSGGELLRMPARPGPSEQVSSVPAFLDDYAYLTRGLLELFQVSGEERYLEQALALTETLHKQFWDEEKGGYFQTSNRHEVLLARDKSAYDGAEPSGNSIAAENLLLLGNLLDAPEYRARAERIFRTFSADLTQGVSAPQMLAALDTYHAEPLQVILVISPEENEESRKMERIVRETYLPGAVRLIVPDAEAGKLARKVPALAGKRAKRATTAYVCERGGCELPAKTAAILQNQLARRFVGIL